MKLLISLFVSLLIVSAAESEQIQLAKKSKLAKKNGSIVNVATNTQSGEMLVVWTKPRVPSTAIRAEIVGRIFNAKGKPVTKVMSLASLPDQDVGRASVDYNPNLNEYLLVFDYYSNVSCHIFSLRLNAGGKPIGRANKITNDPDIQTYCNNAPQVLYNPKTEGHTAFWEVHVFGGCGIGRCTYQAGISLSDQGVPIGSAKPIATGFNSPDELDWYCADWAYLTSSNKIIGRCFGGGLGFDGVKPGIYYLAGLDPQLKGITKSNFAPINNSPIHVPNPSPCSCDASDHLALISNNSAVVFYADSSGAIKGRGVNGKGKKSGPAFAAFNSPKQDTRFYLLHASFTDTVMGKRGILIGTERENIAPAGTVDGPSNVWVQPLNEKGKPIGSPVKILTVTDDAWVYSHIEAMRSIPTDSSFLFTAFESIGYEAAQKAQSNNIARLLLKLIVP